MDIKKSSVIYELENRIKSGKSIIIFNLNNLVVLHSLYDCLVCGMYSNIEIWQSIEEMPMQSQSCYLVKDQLEEIIEIYCMYQFSDKVSVVTNSAQYGNLINYIQTGIITEKEFVDALLYKI